MLLLVMLPVLLPALLPLIIILLLPVILLGMMFKGSAGPAIGCLGTAVGRVGRRQARPEQPGGLSFRVRLVDQSIREIQFRGRPPRVELGDELEVAGFTVGAVLHTVQLRNNTTGDRQFSRIVVLAPVLVIVLLIAASALVGK